MAARFTGLWVSNFRSLGDEVHLDLGDFTALVGPNGAGKSNVLDVFRFLRDALTVGLEPALTHRLGIERVRRASSRGARDVSITVDVDDGGRLLRYGLVIKSGVRGRHRVDQEHVWETLPGQTDPATVLSVVRGVLHKAPEGLLPTVSDDELTLLGIAAHPSVRPLVDALRSVRVHSLYPHELSQPQSGGAPPPLDDTGTNWCSVLRSLSGPARRELVDAMGVVLDDVVGVAAVASGGYYTATFTHRLANGETRQFAAAQESDGTLRLAGLLTALVQDDLPPLLALEEPELTVDPGLLPLLHDHLREAAGRTQVVITTHSPDLLDLLDIDDVRVVERREGATTIGAVALGQRETVRDGLLAPGGLLRSGGFTVEDDGADLLGQLTARPPVQEGP